MKMKILYFLTVLVVEVLPILLRGFIISVIVVCGWRLLEYEIYGAISPNVVDYIIGLILISSITLNIALIEDVRKRDKYED